MVLFRQGAPRVIKLPDFSFKIKLMKNGYTTQVFNFSEVIFENNTAESFYYFPCTWFWFFQKHKSRTSELHGSCSVKFLISDKSTTNAKQYVPSYSVINTIFQQAI